MLRCLRIERFLLIEDIEVEFGDSLNVISGETGTGKSMTISAIEFVMERGGNYEDGTAVEIGLERGGEEIILRREISKGRSRYFINGRGTSYQMVKEILGESLSVQGQNEFTRILRSDFQRDLLDSVTGARELRGKVERLYDRKKSLSEKLSSLAEKRNSLIQQRDFLEFRIKEIEDIGIPPEEVDDIREKARKLNELEKVMNHLSSALYSLYGSQQSAHAQVSSALKDISEIASLLEKGNEVTATLERIKEEIYELYLKLSDRDFEFSQTEVDRINDIVFRIQELERKYGKSYADIVRESEEIRKQLGDIDSLEVEIERIKEEIEKVNEELIIHTRELSQLRKEGALKIEKKIREFLQQLGLERAVVRFDIRESNIKRHGKDEVRLLFSSYGGELEEVEKTASGGELSRLFLALALIKPPSETYIFDEVDAGISGETSLRVARLLRILSKSMQIIAITHSSALCAAGDVNLLTEKVIEGSKARIMVKPLSPEEKEREVARLMGATTEKTLEGARELIRMVRE